MPRRYFSIPQLGFAEALWDQGSGRNGVTETRNESVGKNGVSDFGARVGAAGSSGTSSLPIPLAFDPCASAGHHRVVAETVAGLVGGAFGFGAFEGLGVGEVRGVGSCVGEFGDADAQQAEACAVGFAVEHGFGGAEDDLGELG